MQVEKYIPELAEMPESIKKYICEVFDDTYKERKKISGKKAVYSARAKALSEAYKMLSRNIVDRGKNNA